MKNNIQITDGLVILFALLAIYIIWRVAKVDNSEFKKMDTFKKDVQAEISAISARLDTIHNKTMIMGDSLEKLTVQVWEEKKDAQAMKFELEKQIEEAQEHLVKIRQQQLALREKITGRKVQVNLAPNLGPIPIEIHQTKKSKSDPKLIKKIKKQINGLSK